MDSMDNEETTKVLIAEDNYLVSQMIKGTVEDIGYTVAGEASDGVEAINLVCTLKPDVVLMDIDMPEMNGIEASQRIHNTCPTPVVILTAYDSPEFINQASRVGVGAFLRKPPNRQDLESAITVAVARFADLLQLRHLNQELQARNEQLQVALDQIKVLKGLLPICASCKKIRDDQGYWHEVEVYIRDHSEVDFSHGLCPHCLTKLYPDLY